VNSTREIYNFIDGSTDNDSLLRGYAERILCFSTDIEKLEDKLKRLRISESILANRGLFSLTDQRDKFGKTLLDILNDLKIEDDSHRQWKSLKQAVRSIVKRKKIRDIGATMDKIRNEITTHLLVLQR
jgi:hypothetical protein